MLSLDEQYIDSLMMGLNRALNAQWFPNLLYRDIQVSPVMYTDEIVATLTIRFKNQGFSLSKITAPNSNETWLRVRKI